MNLREKEAVLQYHHKRLNRPRVEALGWRSVETQEQRFEILCKWGNLSNTSVLDLGCGYGDLKNYLDTHFRDVLYFGVDMVPEFIAEAKKSYCQQSTAQFFLIDFLSAESLLTSLPNVDVIMASGSMNYKCTNPEHPYTTIRRMWNAARQGIAFNLLDATKQKAEGPLQVYDPQVVLAFCQQLDPHAELVTGYHPEDFTVLMRH